MNTTSVRPNPNGSAEPSVDCGRTGSAELFGQIAEPQKYVNLTEKRHFDEKIAIFSQTLLHLANQFQTD